MDQLYRPLWLLSGVKGRFDDYSMSPKIGKFLLHWGYELVENNL